MRYLPVFLRVDGRRCVVVGGGAAAERRVRDLLETDAQAVLVGAAITPALAAMAKAGTLVYRGPDFQASDLDGAALVYVTSDDRTLAGAVVAEANRRGIPVNVADAPEACSFISPAVMRRGALQIAVSTSGASPATARRLRAELESRFGPEYAPALELMRAARRLLREREPDPQLRARKLKRLAESDLANCIARGESERIERLLVECVGFGAVELGIDPALFNIGRGRDERAAR
ncbi:MAG TPA: bifunctional precorrin-2 dehydrogenase/sirohydrochlorin ferrochelatase [Candidatus Binataceae bacterium]|jgi:precorrin-2 dehydrogenase/sirohydrochlorin ferrochelatase|nr:bifunctional precorrin-2 dehydrogenase/sirohydrochlorin ferrochelatase [Candidatus Binataceae bacterium]